MFFLLLACAPEREAPDGRTADTDADARISVGYDTGNGGGSLSGDTAIQLDEGTWSVTNRGTGTQYGYVRSVPLSNTNRTWFETWHVWSLSELTTGVTATRLTAAISPTQELSFANAANTAASFTTVYQAVVPCDYKTASSASTWAPTTWGATVDTSTLRRRPITVALNGGPAQTVGELVRAPLNAGGTQFTDIWYFYSGYPLPWTTDQPSAAMVLDVSSTGAVNVAAGATPRSVVNGIYAGRPALVRAGDYAVVSTYAYTYEAGPPASVMK
jgi:hypothetical protein